MQTDRHKSIYRFAAEDGPIISIPLIVVAFSILLSTSIPAITILAIPALASLPFLLFSRMKRLALQVPPYAAFFPQWLFGIYAGIFATLICALLAAIYLIFIDPSFPADYFRNAAAALDEISRSQSADLSLHADNLRRAAEMHLLPSPMELVAAMSWLSAFSCSLVSAFVARASISLALRK